MHETKWYGLDGKWYVAHYFAEQSMGSRSLCHDRVLRPECTHFPRLGGTYKRCAECTKRMDRMESQTK